MGSTVCLLLLGAVFVFCGWAIFRAAGAITEQEIQPPDPEPRIVPMRKPWQQPSKTIVLSQFQQADLLQIYREEFVSSGRVPEMPLLAFLRAVEDHQRPDKPIEVEVHFAQLQWLRSFADEHGLEWLRYAVDVAFQTRILY